MLSIVTTEREYDSARPAGNRCMGWRGQLGINGGGG